MDPPNPPLPTAMNLPFHAVVGSQSSALMFESSDGVSTMRTRQCSGSLGGRDAWPAARPGGGAGCVADAAWPAVPCWPAGAAAPPCLAPPARPPRPAGTYGPAGTAVASVIRPSRIVKDVSDSHVA